MFQNIRLVQSGKQMIMQHTSLEANVASKPNRETNHTKILEAMRKLPNREGTSDAIASYCTLDKIECSRRLGELVDKGLVVNTMRKGITAKGCKAYIWKLTEQPNTKLQATLF